jgi:hypothetical protein
METALFKYVAGDGRGAIPGQNAGAIRGIDDDL